MLDGAILEFITKYGVTGLALVGWWLERTERIATQKALQQLIPDGIKAMTESAHAVRALRQALFPSGTRKNAALDPRDG